MFAKNKKSEPLTRFALEQYIESFMSWLHKAFFFLYNNRLSAQHQ